jgi:hypothetical protein
LQTASVGFCLQKSDISFGLSFAGFVVVFDEPPVVAPVPSLSVVVVVLVVVPPPVVLVVVVVLSAGSSLPSTRGLVFADWRTRQTGESAVNRSRHLPLRTRRSRCRIACSGFAARAERAAARRGAVPDFQTPPLWY